MRQRSGVSGIPILLAVFCVSRLLAGGVGTLYAGEKTAATNGQCPTSHSNVSPRVIRDANVLLTKYPGSRSHEPNEVESSNDTRVEIVERGSSSRSTRKAALSALPLDVMTQRNRERANDVLRSLSVFRRLPTVTMEVEPDVYRFFTTYPDVAVSTWRAMKISKFQMWQTGQHEYEADAGDGTLGIIDILYRGWNEIIIICEGEYKNPLLAKPIQSKAVIHLETKYSQAKDGKTYATHRADLFVSFPSQTVETAAKVLSPVSNMIVDHNFREVSLFLHMMSLAMANQPGWIEQLAGKLDGVLEIRKTQLMKLAARVYVTCEKRRLRNAQGSDEVSLDQVLRPLLHTSTKHAGSPSRGTTPSDSLEPVRERRSGVARTVSNEKPVPTPQ